MKRATPARILVVDDDLLTREMILYHLRDFQFDLVTAEDGVEALERVAEKRPDLILLDIVMPRLDGFKVCRRLKRSPATETIPVIFLSSLNKPKHIIHGFRVGAVDYIVKPFVPEILLARVTLHLEQHRIRESLRRRLETLETQLPADGGASRTDESTQENINSGELLRSLEWATAYLIENLSTPPSLDELARIGRTNRTTLNRCFQSVFGVTVYEWLTEQRLLRASQLLRSTNQMVLEIGLSVGFETHAGFSAAFKRRFGLTPTHYRRQTQAA